VPGDHLRTRLAQITVLLKCVRRDAFDVHVDRSLASYLSAWLNAHRVSVESLPIEEGT
jgi:sarcosine oxidase gamma subunit